MDILKLILKKEIFEQVKKEDTTSLTFEITPFYLSRFTTSKYNTVENLKKDGSLFKKFDKIQFTCAAESVEYDVEDITLVEENGETKFSIHFLKGVNTNDEYEDKDVKEVVKPVVEKQDEQNTEIEEILNEEHVAEETNKQNENVQIKQIVEKQDEQVKETTQVKSKTNYDNSLEELLSHKNIFVVKSRIARIGYMGNVWGVDDKKLPIHNEHEQILTLDKLVLPLDKMVEKLKEYIKSGYVFIDKDNMNITDSKVELYIKYVNRFDTINWL